MKKTLCALSLGLLTSISSFHVLANQAGDISVSDPFAREVPPGAPASASYMMLKNSSDKAIKLVEVSSNAAKTVELHTHTNDKGVMRMRQVSFLEVPAKGQKVLKPGGDHIMLINPPKPFKEGQTVTLTLKFEDGSTKQVDMPVKSLIKKMSDMNHDMHKHH